MLLKFGKQKASHCQESGKLILLVKRASILLVCLSRKQQRSQEHRESPPGGIIFVQSITSVRLLRSWVLGEFVGLMNMKRMGTGLEVSIVSVQNAMQLLCSQGINDYFKSSQAISSIASRSVNARTIF